MLLEFQINLYTYLIYNMILFDWNQHLCTYAFTSRWSCTCCTWSEVTASRGHTLWRWPTLAIGAAHLKRFPLAVSCPSDLQLNAGWLFRWLGGWLSSPQALDKLFTLKLITPSLLSRCSVWGGGSKGRTTSSSAGRQGAALLHKSS